MIKIKVVDFDEFYNFVVSQCLTSRSSCRFFYDACHIQDVQIIKEHLLAEYLCLVLQKNYI